MDMQHSDFTMKNLSPPDKTVIKRSFASRLTLYILGICVLTFMIAAGLFLLSAGRIAKQEASHHAQSELTNVLGQINGLLQQVQVTTTGMEWAIRQKLNSPDELIKLNSQIIRNNKHIIGSCIAFKAGYYPEKGEMFAPYATCRPDGTTDHLNLGSETYDYHAQPWYTVAAETGKPHWTDPYFDKGGADDIITTFSHPIKDENGEVFAILTADISLKHLADMVLAIRPYPHAYCFMLDRKGNYAVHHKRDRILYQNVKEATNYMPDRNIENLISGMLSKRSGMEKIMDGDNPCYVFYSTVDTTGWPIALVCPKEEVFAVMGDLTIMVITVFLLGGVFLLLMCRWIIHRTSQPIKRFSEAATQVAQGNLSAPLPEIKSGDELEYFRDTFAYMQNSLVEYIQELKKTTGIKERMQGELHVARRIQMGMIPKIFPPYPERPELDLYAKLRPAREVGGDLYDFFIVNNRLYLTVGDVSGKGVPASLVMAITCRLIRLIAAQTDSPAQMAKVLNDSLSADNETNMFVTMFIGVLNLEDGTFTYCNAGHNPPILALPDRGATFHEVDANVPVGILPGFEFTEQSIQLPDHGAFFLYTDGVNEAENKSAEQFGDKRMLSIVQRHCCESARTIVSSVLDEVDDFAADAEQSDDITMLCLRYHKTFNGNTTPMEPKTLTISNKLEDLKLLPDFIEDYCNRLPIPLTLILSLNLAIEEAMVNCVQYAYAENTTGEISLSVNWDDVHHELTFVLSDAGAPFDPTATPEPDTALSAEERPIGGLGILLVRKIMDRVSYSRDGEQNVLTMCKKIYAHTPTQD